jgi:hypothetical protein
MPFASSTHAQQEGQLHEPPRDTHLHVKVAQALPVCSQDAVGLGLCAGVLRLPELAQLLWLEEHVPALQLHAHRALQDSRLRKQI